MKASNTSCTPTTLLSLGLMFKLLIISGPTATGKTGIALKLAKKFNGELISADSRQIYRGMDIGTGKDHPKDVKIHLIDIINPNQSFSVSQYYDLAIATIKEIQNKNKLPIIVGGTGLYVDSIINPRSTFNIKPNYFLRFFLNRLPVKLLQLTLRLLDFKTFKQLNNSDVNNSRRLIRKIEISLSSRRDAVYGVSTKDKYDILHISLTDNIDNIIKKIDARIQSRLKMGLFDEIKKLLKKYKWTDPGFNTIAYKEFKTGFTPKNINIWKIHEHQYAHRQITWFKKFSPDYYIDISKPKYKKQIDTLVSKWYNNSYDNTKG